MPLKATVDKALEEAPSVEKVLVYKRLGDAHVKIEMKAGRDLDWYVAIAGANAKNGETPEIVDAEHPLYILYTSGSTGKPKGVLHTTAGYLAGTHVTTKYVFDLRDDDVYWCRGGGGLRPRARARDRRARRRLETGHRHDRGAASDTQSLARQRSCSRPAKLAWDRPGAESARPVAPESAGATSAAPSPANR